MSNKLDAMAESTPRDPMSCRGVTRCRHLLLAGACYLCPANALAPEEYVKIAALKRYHGLTYEGAIRLVREVWVDVSAYSGGITYYHG